MKTTYKTLSFVLAAALLASCTWDPAKNDIPVQPQTMAVTASAEAVTILEESMASDKITFTWTDAREMSDDYYLTYETKLDVLGNNFGSKTVIKNTFEAGENSISFTLDQINTWASERWEIPVNREFDLEFRVVASWTGGSSYEIPEVKTVTVHVTPLKVIIFDADKMSVGGTAVDETEIHKTLENDQQYAWKGDLKVGELLIPVEYDGGRYYICPKDHSSTLHDGEAIDIVMEEEPVAWNITEAGAYRVVVNMEMHKLTIYSPKTDLQPLVVEWYPNMKAKDEVITDDKPKMVTTVDKIWARGESAGWDKYGKDMKVTVSLADPQILIYQGTVMGGGRTDFAIASKWKVEGYNNGNEYTANNSYVFAPVYTGSNYDQSVTLKEWIDIEGGSYLRGNYFKMPGNPKVNFIIFDLRNMRMWLETRE